MSSELEEGRASEVAAGSIAGPEEMADQDAEDEASRAGKPRVVLSPVHQSITDGHMILSSRRAMREAIREALCPFGQTYQYRLT